MFVAFDREVRVSLAVVTLGTPARLRGCLDALTAHESRHDFTVAVVVNADTPDGAPPPTGAVDAPDGVLVDPVPVNLGWAGGLHRARALTDAELFVWVQDDMVPEPGWLDALVDAADAHPGVAGFGAVRVGDDGRVALHNAGRAEPVDAVERWNDTDTTPDALPTGVTTYDWVTSKGFLTRTGVFDEVGGPDPRQWPLNHVDKEYCTHLRCHGYDVVLVPDARLRHAGSQSAPTEFRAFLAHWREPWLNQRWAGPVAALAGRSSGVVDHPCADWRSVVLDPVAAAVGAEATRMLVPVTRAQSAVVAELRLHAERLEHALTASTAHAGDLEPRLAEATAHAADLERALVVATHERDRARRRARRLRRRLRNQTSSLSWRITRPLRGFRRR